MKSEMRTALAAGSLVLGLWHAGLGAAEPEDGDGVADEQAKRCVSLHAIRNTRVLDDSNIVFEMAGGKTLVNKLPHKCPGLGFEKRFAYKTSLSQLCNTDIIWVLTTTGRGASCGLGLFEPWVAPEPAPDKPGDGVLEPAS